MVENAIVTAKTQPSRRLHVVQSGVSSAIQGLERDLGAALFERDRRRVALTAQAARR
jgi:DNA-binding transcriptional LysR family regulator